MSTTVLLGTNRFIDCRNLLAVADEPVLRLVDRPLRLSLHLPADTPSAKEVWVEENAVGGADAGQMQVVVSEDTVGLFWNDFAIAMATRIRDDTLVLKVDLRPLGLNIYDDAQGLHVGPNCLADNTFKRCTTGIGLAAQDEAGAA